MRWRWAAFALLAGAGPVLASGYDDLTTGINAIVRHDSKQAITSFTAALAANDLAPPYVPLAHRSRALAYLDEGRCTEAKADLDAYMAQKSLDRSGELLLAQVQLCLKDYAGAQISFATAMAMFPDAAAYWWFGRAQWKAGLLEEAHPNLLQAAQLVRKDHNRTAAYMVIWYAMTADRVGKLDHAKLDKLEDDLSGSDWPMPVVNLYRGKLTPEEAAAKAGRGDDGVIAGQKCEADFYVGEWYLARGKADAAKPLIASAVAHCPKEFIETSAAVAEAARLGLAKE